MDLNDLINEWVRLEEVGIEIANMYNAELDKVKKEGLISVHLHGLAEQAAYNNGMITATVKVILKELPKEDRRYELASARIVGIERELEGRIAYSRDGLNKLLSEGIGK